MLDLVHQISSIADVKERVVVHLFSSMAPSYPIRKWNALLPFLLLDPYLGVTLLQTYKLFQSFRDVNRSNWQK
jgi:hypothetical protein